MKNYIITYGLQDEDYEQEIEAVNDYSAYLRGSQLVYDMISERKYAKGVHMKIKRKDNANI